MYLCTDCGNESLKWQWQCPTCKAWNTLKEFKEAKIKWKGSVKWEIKNLTQIQDIKEVQDRIKTSSTEFNNVIWGGIVRWSVILLSGEPGIWKSTITLQLSNWVKESVVYISWEETEHQIFDRAKRLKIAGKNLKVLSESSLENTLTTLAKNPSDIVIVDSVSVMHSENSSGSSGSISQVRYISEKLVEFAKRTNTAMILIGHINKDGWVAGPKTLEHMVDTVLYFEWDKFDDLRLLRGLKNRFWATSEVWLFKMWQTGLSDIKNPGLEFITNEQDATGSSLSITMEWTRPIIIETESLTTYTKFGYPKRSARGMSASKLDLIVAVLGKYTAIKLDSYDVYSNISRGLKIAEPWIDLSLAASIVSSKLGKNISKSMIFIWEISLTGKIKKVIFLEKRIKEAEKMWFKTIVIPDVDVKIKTKIEVIKLKSINDLLKIIN